MPIIFENVEYSYAAGTPFEDKALRGIDLRIEDGEFVALIGHTGSGKSTLIQHINALNKPTAGRVIVCGVDTGDKKADLKSLRRRVGLVFQYPEYQLFEETVALDVGYGPKNMGLDADEVKARVTKALTLVGVDMAQYAQKSPFELSGGQKRRVAIAGVLAMEPDILILDEPSAGLDPRGRADMQRLICSIQEQRHCTVIFVTHNMNEAAQIATRIIVMNNGRVFMDGTAAEVFSHAAELASIGLDVPDMVRITDIMRKRGIDVPCEITTPEALAQYVKEALRGV